MSKARSFSSNEGVDKMIEELKETGQYLSDSEIIRAGIRLLYKRQFPYYKVVAEIKEDEQETLAELQQLPIEEYVERVFQCDPKTEGLKIRPGYCHLKHRNNPARVADIELEFVKTYGSRNEVWKKAGIALET